MKRFFCALMTLIFLPAFAFALDLQDFNDYAAVLGASEIDIKQAKKSGKYTGIVSDDCSIYFVEENEKLQSIIIDGKGDSYLAYCCAAIRTFDPSGSTTQNHGQLLTMYLLAHNASEHQTGQTSNGIFFFVEPSKTGFLFMIGEH